MWIALTMCVVTIRIIKDTWHYGTTIHRNSSCTTMIRMINDLPTQHYSTNLCSLSSQTAPLIPESFDKISILRKKKSSATFKAHKFRAVLIVDGHRPGTTHSWFELSVFIHQTVDEEIGPPSETDRRRSSIALLDIWDSHMHPDGPIRFPANSESHGVASEGEAPRECCSADKWLQGLLAAGEVHSWSYSLGINNKFVAYLCCCCCCFCLP